MPNGDCTTGVELRQKVEAVKEETERLAREDDQQWTAINKLRDLLQRPPAWCAWAMTALGTVAGALGGILATVLFG